MKLISDQDLGTIENRLIHHLDGQFKGDCLAPLYAPVKEFVLRGGKRIRPQLCLWTFHAAAQQPDAANASAAANIAALDVACAWEIFHAFLLIHDDIIDQAHTRRGLPALHRTLAELPGGGARTGTSLAIIAGDLLFTSAMNLLHSLDVPANIHREILRLFSRTATTTGRGQAMDILQMQKPLDQTCEQELLREYRDKTAAYTFEAPMLSGAILAGASTPAQDSLSRFALALGQAYQLQNDLDDLSRPAQAGCDLLEGKRTIPLLRARGAMDASRRSAVDRTIAELPHANGSAVRLAEELRGQIISSGAFEKTRLLIDSFCEQARDAAREPALPAPLSFALQNLLDELARCLAPAS